MTDTPMPATYAADLATKNAEMHAPPGWQWSLAYGDAHDPETVHRLPDLDSLVPLPSNLDWPTDAPPAFHIVPPPQSVATSPLTTQFRELVEALREMDRLQQYTDSYGGREIAWYYARDDIEDILRIPRNSLDNAPPPGWTPDG